MAAVTALPPPVIVNLTPPNQHTHTVIFLHGRGDNAPSFSQFVLAGWRDSRGQTLGDHFPTFRFVFAQAPVRRVASSAPPGESWPQWFDVWNTRDFADNEMLQAEGLREVVPLITRDVLAPEAEMLGGRWDRVVLAGISMGAATAVHVLFNMGVPPGSMRVGGDGDKGGEFRLGAFMGFSCRCPFAGRSGSLREMRAVLALREDGDGSAGDDDVLRNTPMLMEHCVDDPLVLVQNGRQLRDILTGFGATVEWHEYPDGGHWFHGPEGLDDVVAFLKKALS